MARLTGRDRLHRAMSERELQYSLEQLFNAASWLWYHAPDNRPGPGGYVQNVKAGFPDLVVIDPGSRQRTGPRMVALELKRQVDSDPTPDQLQWLAQFGRVGAYAAVIRPAHLALVQAVVIRGAAWPAIDPITFEPC